MNGPPRGRGEEWSGRAMLIKIREKSGGWVAKIILGVLVVAFAVFFGFGDFSRLGGGASRRRSPSSAIPRYR